MISNLLSVGVLSLFQSPAAVRAVLRVCWYSATAEFTLPSPQYVFPKPHAPLRLLSKNSSSASGKYCMKMFSSFLDLPSKWAGIRSYLVDDRYHQYRQHS